VHLVTRAIKEAGVDEKDAGLHGADRLFEINRGAALLIHDTNFKRVARHAEQIFDAAKDFVGKGRFFRTMHLGFDDIDRTSTRVAEAITLLFEQIVLGDQRCDDGIHQPFEDLFAVAIQHRRVGHQMTDIADQQHRAPVQTQNTARRRQVFAIRVQAAGHGFTALFKRVFQLAVQASCLQHRHRRQNLRSRKWSRQPPP